MKRSHPDNASRRAFLARAAALGFAGWAGSAARLVHAENFIDLPFDNGRRERVSDFPQKSTMILQRVRPPLLETPFEVFDQGVFTPNDRFYVRWHLAGIPTDIDPRQFRLEVVGGVRRRLSLTMRELVHDFEPVELAAVNQCSGNSRGLFTPRVPGGQWYHGAMGNALWRGVRLKDVLDRARMLPGAMQVRFTGLDTGVLAQTPQFMKSLAVDHARDGEVMIAYEMNGEPLPLLNGYPLRLVVPGWYATYWVKMLKRIEVLDAPDDNYWMAKAYLIPDTPGANVAPGAPAVPQVPINRMIPRSFCTNLKTGQTLPRAEPILVRGIAFGGDCGVERVLVSIDGGARYQQAQLGPDLGKYSFRRWETVVHFPTSAEHQLKVKCVNTNGLEQPAEPNWNPGGYMRNVIETTTVRVS